MNQFSKSRNTTSTNSNTATGGNAGRQLSLMMKNPRTLQSLHTEENNGKDIFHNADSFSSSRVSRDISMKNTINGRDKSATEYSYKSHAVKYTLSPFFGKRYLNIDVVGLFIESAVEVVKEKFEV